ncbi:ATP-dependent Clp protease adaptor protein ClpS [Olavius algarvensis associated proteobacterium Delta 3]|nr:ATP-dependent Clp protease adaptor protein ClpS [Olavius algarvensis associated proteobacterium Delta 3]CAB5131952.1 ATP-dependent Clp protease adaptor protein ClpS [Olavius algarvensis associated proteobacterium Delta 3]
MNEKSPEIKERVEIEEDVQKPSMFKVLIYNDDYTTKEFVVEVLVTVFHKSRESAIRLMFSVHQNGVGVCGVYPLEVAETKVNVVLGKARDHGYPLQLGLEEE